MPTAAIDVRDAFVKPLRGWGRYALELLHALGERDGLALRPLRRGVPGPELLFEQIVLPALLARERPALVHATNCFLPLVRPCPGVVTVHDLAFEEHPEDFAPRTGWKYRTFTPRAVRSAQRVICDSRHCADDLVARYGADEERIRVIPLAPALALGGEPPPPGPYLLAVGDLRAKKNLLRLVRAWRALRAGGLEHRLVLAGVDGGEGPALRAAAGDAPLELTGYVTDARLDALYRGADLVVHPSLYEGFGLVLLEAMVRGVPVAAARATALPQTGGDAAAFFDPLDEGDIAAVLARVLGSADERSRMIEAGRARAAGFTWAGTATATAAVYEELF